MKTIKFQTISIINPDLWYELKAKEKGGLANLHLLKKIMDQKNNGNDRNVKPGDNIK